MRLLAIETSVGAASVALMQDGAIVGEEYSSEPRAHVEFLMPAIERLCDLRTLDALAVDIGPGGFSGLRAGVATAKALAQALGIGVHPVGSLQALSDAAPQANWLCLDSGRGRVYARPFAGETKVWEAADLAEELGDEPLAGWAPYPEMNGCLWVHRERPRARDIALAARLVAPVSAEKVEPVYLRGTDTKIAWEGSGAIIERPDRVKIKGER